MYYDAVNILRPISERIIISHFRITCKITKQVYTSIYKKTCHEDDLYNRFDFA